VAEERFHLPSVRPVSTHSRARRFVLALLAVCLLAGDAVALADPIDDVQRLLASVAEVKATGTGPTTVMVSWQNTSLWPNILYRIEISESDTGPWRNALSNNALAQPNVCSSNGTCMTPVVGIGPAADPAPKWFRVVPIVSLPAVPSVSGVYNGTGPTTLVEGKPSEPDPAILGPFAPTNVLCNGGDVDSLACVNVNSITLTWNDNSDEVAFWVMRAKAAANPNFGAKFYVTRAADVTSFSETLRDYSSTFWYRILAIRQREIPSSDGSNFYKEFSYSTCTDSGDPSDSDEKNFCAARVLTAPVPAPNDPTGLTATFVPPDSAKLSWIDQSPPGRTYVDEDGWFIELGTSNARGQAEWESQLTRAAQTGQGVITYTDVRIPPDTTRCYRVRGYRLGPAFSKYSPDANEPTVCLGTTPRAPDRLVADALSNANVKLNWRDNSESESSFDIERCTGACVHSTPGWSKVGEVEANVTDFVDTSTSGLTTYSYRVLAVNSSGRSAPSNVARVTTLRSPLPAPTNLQTFPGQHFIDLVWNDNSTTETGFRIEYRDPDSFDWNLLTNDVPRNRRTWRDRGLAARQRRCYRVRAIKADPEISDPSNESCDTTLPPARPDADPTGMGADAQSNVRILVSWNDRATNEDGYAVEYHVFPNIVCSQAPSVDDRTPFATLGRVTSESPEDRTLTRYAASGLIPHSSYFFRVKAYNQDGESGFSPISGCTQTFGPARPNFDDPSDDAQTATTQCDFTVNAPATAAAGTVERVGGLLVFVNAYVPSTGVGSTDALFVTANGGTVPGAPAADDPPHNRYLRTEGGGLSISNDSNGSHWRVDYKFRHGVKYRLLATAYAYHPTGEPSTIYGSAQRIRNDFTVVADCPTSGL
jgi:hypothetical protein